MLTGHFTKLWASARRMPPWSVSLGLARSMMALATMGTLLASPATSLFRPAVGDPVMPRCAGLGEASFFCIGSGPLELYKWVAILVLGVVASGWLPRVTGLLHAWVTWSLVASAMIVDGGDQVNANMALLLLPWTLTDGRKWHWLRAEAPAAPAPGYALACGVALVAWTAARAQVALIYLDASLGKMFVTEWVDGTAVYYWFTHPTFGAPGWLRGVIEPLVRNGVTVALVSWGTIVLEFFLAIALFLSRRWQRGLFPLGLALHVGILFVHGLTSFSTTMCGVLLLYIGPRDLQLSAAWEHAREAFSRRRQRPVLSPPVS
jgi:antimicrobial peptide system SdpB family protein